MVYPGWLALFLALPLALVWATRGRLLWRCRRALGLTLLGALLLGGLWDALAVRVHIWYYAAANIAGLWLLGLPVEEWLWISGTALLFGCLAVLVKEREGDHRA